MGDFVLEKIGCYTVKIPHAFGAFCVLLVPFLSLHHAKTQSGGPHQDAISMLVRSSSCKMVSQIAPLYL